jgi:hypothetical protein
MCTEPGHPHNQAAVLVPPAELDVELPDPVALAPVEAVTLTTPVDNSSHLLLPDQGPVKRAGLLAAASASRLATSVLDTGEASSMGTPASSHSLIAVFLRPWGPEPAGDGIDQADLVNRGVPDAAPPGLVTVVSSFRRREEWILRPKRRAPNVVGDLRRARQDSLRRGVAFWLVRSWRWWSEACGTGS